jgi:threonine synthase
MRFYSTNNKNINVSLREAVMQGLAPDKGLYMPEEIPRLPGDFLATIERRSFREIAFAISRQFTGEEVPEDVLAGIIAHTIEFDAPVVNIEGNVYALELFHGPTLAFKDFGARFMSRLLAYFARNQQTEIIVLVATSGDTGSAVANGFLGVPGTKVVVLYPAGKVSEIQEKQFTTLGNNITAVEVKGTFDDCQRLVKQAFLDEELRRRFFLTSANSINIARLIPQSFYYFQAYAQLKITNRPFVFAVPSGNFGNLTGGLLANRMGLPVKKFIACTNINDVVPNYLESGVFNPRPSLHTISNAMDVGDPSNFARLLDLYHHDSYAMATDISAYAFTDRQTSGAIRDVFNRRQYIMDPHGAIGYLGLKKHMENDSQVTGVFLETAHPAKFKDTVENIIVETNVTVPETLNAFLVREKISVAMTSRFEDFRDYLVASN